MPLRNRYGDRSLSGIQLPPMVGASGALITCPFRRMAIPERARTSSASFTPGTDRTGASSAVETGSKCVPAAFSGPPTMTATPLVASA